MVLRKLYNWLIFKLSQKIKYGQSLLCGSGTVWL